MTIESATYVASLDPTYPLAGDPIGEGDDHLRLIKTTVTNSFPNVAGAVTKTHTELNETLSSNGGDLNGSINFTDIAYTVTWDMPTAANPVEISAVEYTDPVFFTTNTGLRLGAAGVHANYPPIPNLTNGFFVYNQVGDTARESGILFMDYNPSTGTSVQTGSVGFSQTGSTIIAMNNLVSNGDLALTCKSLAGGDIIFADGHGNTITLAQIISRLNP